MGQEWAWNFHFLPPEFLTDHEDAFISLLISTWAKHGVHVSRPAFVECYALGALQMYVFSGGGLPAIAKRLRKRGLWEGLMPNDKRCSDATLDKESLELLVGAEMSRRAFTNACNIMRRHDFLAAWQRWAHLPSDSEVELERAAWGVFTE